MSAADNNADAQPLAGARFFDKRGGEQPLARARAWAAANSAQGDALIVTPMLLVAEEQEFGRRFMAATLDALWQYVRSFARDSERHLHEVVPPAAPCRLYCDLEYEFGRAERDEALKHATLTSSRAALRDAIDKSASEFIDALKRAASSEYGVQLTEFVSTSHKPSKWSAHVVFRGAAWRSARHCGAFVQHVARMRRQFDPCVEHYVDSGVYNANHCLRMYRATKRAEPQRSLVARGETHDAPLSRERWAHSLITHFYLAPPGTEYAAAQRDNALLEFTSVFLAEYFDEFAGADAGELRLRVLEHADAAARDAHRDRRIVASVRAAGCASRDTGIASCSTTAHDSDAEQLRALQEQRGALAELFAEYEPRAFKLLDGRPWLRVDCRSHRCALLRGEHRSNTIFLMVDYAQKRMRQQCYDPQCKRAPRLPWQDLRAADHSAVAALDALMDAWPAARTAPELARWLQDAPFARAFKAGQ